MNNPLVFGGGQGGRNGKSCTHNERDIEREREREMERWREREREGERERGGGGRKSSSYPEGLCKDV